MRSEKRNASILPSLTSQSKHSVSRIKKKKKEMKRKKNAPSWLLDVSGEYTDPSECEDRIKECMKCGEEFDSWNPHLSSDEICFDCEENEIYEYLKECRREKKRFKALSQPPIPLVRPRS